MLVCTTTLGLSFSLITFHKLEVFLGRSCPEVTTLFTLCNTRLFFKLFISLKAQFISIPFPDLSFLPWTMYILHFPCSACSFLLKNFIKVSTNSHVTDSITRLLKLPLLVQLSQHYILASGIFFWQGQKVITVFPKISQERSLGHIQSFFSSLTSWTRPLQFKLPSPPLSFMLLLIWLINKYLKLQAVFWNQTLKSSHFLYIKHGQVYHSITWVPGTNFCGVSIVYNK